MVQISSKRGFTLIELSIVLVIIGLIVGGVLVGQDLVRAAEVRAQITQIEKFNQAVNIFRGKYQSLPGDMNVATADQFGFTVGTNCTGTVGQRDGNGLLQGAGGGSSGPPGETGLFWQDLTTPGLTSLIEGQFPNGGAALSCLNMASGLTVSTVGEYFPAGKIGHGASVMAVANNGTNMYMLQGITIVGVAGGINATTTPITVQEAYKIDQKTDDGLPTSGNIQAVFLNAGSLRLAPDGPSDNTGTCYNNNTNTYSLTVNGGVGANCSLSFAFQ